MANAPQNYLIVRLPVKWIIFFILGISLIAGGTTVLTRYEQLQQLAVTYYHPYLVRAGLSDSFYIWYFLLSECFLAIAFVITAGMIALHRPATWMTVFAAIALILFGVTVPPPLHALIVLQGSLELPFRLLRATGFALFVTFFYIFPDGRFVLPWTRLLTIVLAIWSLLWPFFPSLNPYLLPHPFPFVVLSGWLITGVFAQTYRYLNLTDPAQKQQTKWVVFGLTAAVIGDFAAHIAWYIYPSMQHGPDWLILFLHQPFFIFTQLLVPVSIGVSILQFGLWEIDFIISQTLVYGLLTTFLAASWATIAKLLEGLFGNALGMIAAPAATGCAVLVVGLAFGTTRKYLETFINHHFYPNKVDIDRDFVEFLPEARATIDSLELSKILTSRTLEMFDITYGAVFLMNKDEQLQLVSASKMAMGTVESSVWDDRLLKQINQGSAISRPSDCVFPLLLPLVLRHGKQPKFVGVLALGPLQNGRKYSLDDLWTLNKLASHAGTAMYIAQIDTVKDRELRQKLTVLEDRISLLESRGNSNTTQTP